MPAAPMDGTALAARMNLETRDRAARVADWLGRAPCLATVLIGDDAASVTYVRMKQRRCRDLGIVSRSVELDAATTTHDAVRAVRRLSEDAAVDGILVQHPVPAHVDERAVFEAIAPAKDVDGVTMHSFAAMSLGQPGFAPCTPAGILELLDHHAVALAGANAVVIGRSPILGKPAGMLLLQRDATVTFCHSKSTDVPERVRQADIVIAAVGVANFVRGSWLQPGAVVIDAGYNAGNVGDVCWAEAVEVASLVTPVPGGVGPVTISTLLSQTVEAAANAC